MKKIIFLFITILFSFSTAKALPLPIDITADSMILIDLDRDDIIYEKNPDKIEILASLTKVGTAYTVLKHEKNLNRYVTIDEDDLYNLYGFTCAGLELGDRVTILDLLYATILQSGADSSQALANHVGGSTAKFNEMMNEDIQELGLRNTHFEDSFGRSDNNISTAREFSILLRASLENDIFKKVFSSYQYTLSNGLKVFNYTRSYAIYHGLDPDLITGNKSGYTPEAGLLLASTATINNTHYMLITCKSVENQKKSTHVLDSYKIYDYVTNHQYATRTLIEKGKLLATIPVENGTISEVSILADKNITRVLSEEDNAEVTFEYHLVDSITNQNKKGDNLGFIDVLSGDEIIGSYNLYLQDEVFAPKKSSKKIVIIFILLLFVILLLLLGNIISTISTKIRLKKQ